jgi:hypothetical protein
MIGNAAIYARQSDPYRNANGRQPVLGPAIPLESTSNGSGGLRRCLLKARGRSSFHSFSARL